MFENNRTKISQQAKFTMYCHPIHDLISDVLENRAGKYDKWQTNKLDITYLIYHLFATVIRSMGTSSSGAGFDALSLSLVEEIHVMNPDLPVQEAKNIARFLINRLQNESEGFVHFSYNVFNFDVKTLQNIHFALIDRVMYESDNTTFFKLSEEGFFCFRSMINANVDLLSEMNAFVLNYYIENKDYEQAIQTIFDGFDILKETINSINNLKRKVEYAQVIDYELYVNESKKLDKRVTPVSEKINAIFDLIPPRTGDGSLSDMQIKELNTHFNEYINMLSKTINLLTETKRYISARNDAQINAISAAKFFSFSLYDDVLAPMILMSTNSLAGHHKAISAAMFPAVLPAIESPWYWVQRHKHLLNMDEQSNPNNIEFSKPPALLTDDDLDIYYIDDKATNRFRKLTLNLLEPGEQTLLSVMDTLEPTLNKRELKSFYNYVLCEYCREDNSPFVIEKMDEIVNSSNYIGNNLMIKKYKSEA